MDTNYIKEFNEYLTRIRTRHQELSQKLSEVDLEEQDLLHFLEFEKCDAVTMMKVTKKIKEIRERRRVIKNEWDKLSAVNNRFANVKCLKESDYQKVYTYKTDAAKEFMR